MEAVLIGIVAGLNFLLIYIKIERKRYEDAILDATILLLLNGMFAGSMGGAIIATIGSAFVSLYLLIRPPKFFSRSKSRAFINDFKDRLPK